MSAGSIAVVIVTYESAGHIAGTLGALEGQLRDGDEVIVVDNASRDGTARAVRAAAPGAVLLEQDRNLGFAGGCATGAAASPAPLLLFLNPDSAPAEGCLDALRSAGVEQGSWGAWQALVTMDGGTRINTSGNVAHFLGMGWAGQCGQPLAAAPEQPTEIPFASGAALAVRREAWEQLGGFDSRYFMYGEDLDFGLRLWLSGWKVGIAPAARVEHAYEFAKGGDKWYLLERNRWWTVIGDYPAPLLLLLLPALLASELALLGVAAQGGWLASKLRAQAAVIRELPAIVARRREIQARRRISAAAFARRLSAELDSPYLAGVSRLPLLPALQRAYWWLMLAVLR
ncbi:MAG TPA: glycosyltransferase family 2 protein [Thermoleophilaceae bacterium]|nr:glycosyltransferase family 2 protein [Thermoleophilaceae bacterium]